MRVLPAVIWAVMLLQSAALVVLVGDNNRLKSALAPDGPRVAAIWREDGIYRLTTLMLDENAAYDCSIRRNPFGDGIFCERVAP